LTYRINFTYPQQQSTFKTVFSTCADGSTFVYRTATSPGYNMSALHRHVIGLHLGAPVTIAHWRDERKHTYRFRPGDILFTPLGSPVHYAHADTVDALYIALSPDTVDNIAAQTGLDPHYLSLVDNFGTSDAMLAHMGRTLLSEIQLPGLGSQLMLETLLSQVVIHLLRHYTRMPAAVKPLETEAVEVLQARLRPVIEYVQAHYREDLSLKQLADLLYLTPFHFSRLFKRAFGLSPYQFVIQQRVNAARNMLQDSSLTLTEIALEVGFADHSHLTRHYKRLMGKNPRA
jgi:AraC family transcriptional regulator